MPTYRQLRSKTLAAGLLVLALLVPGRLSAEEKKGAVADSLTPADAELLAKVNIKQILDSALFKKYLLDAAKKGMQDPEAKKFIEATGLDPLTDIDSFTVSNVGTMPPRMLIVIRGKFDQSKIATAAEAVAQKDNKLKIVKEGGYTIYEATNPNNPGTLYSVVPNKGYLLMSNDKDNLLKAARSNAPAKLNSELQTALGKIDGKESFWLAVVVTEEMKKAMQNNPQAQQFAGKLKAITATLNVTDDAHLNVQIHTTDAEAATQLQTVVEGLKGLVEMVAQGNKQAGPVLTEIAKGIKVGTNNNTVAVDLKVSEDQLKQIAAMAKPGAKKDQ